MIYKGKQRIDKQNKLAGTVSLPTVRHQGQSAVQTTSPKDKSIRKQVPKQINTMWQICIIIFLACGIVGCTTNKQHSQPKMPSELPQPMLPSNFLTGENPYAPRMGDAIEIQTF